eukprot:gene5870-6788_t
MVFEGVVAEVIDRFLGSFLQEVTKKQLKIGLFNGNVLLKNVEIKPEALRAFDLPVAVNRGVVGRLVIKVPWTSLKTDPVIIQLQDIYVLASSIDNIPPSDDDEDESQGDKFRRFLKLDKDKKKKTNNKGKEKKSSFKEKLVTKIINNLQIVVEKLHIRYEGVDNVALGVCLDRLFVQSTDSDWLPSFIDAGGDALHKLADVGNVAIYLDHDTPSLSHLSTEALSRALRDSIPTREAKHGHHMLLEPLNASLKLRIAQNGSILQPVSRIEIATTIDDIGVSLEPRQYSSLLSILESLSTFVNDIKEEKRDIKQAALEKKEESETQQHVVDEKTAKKERKKEEKREKKEAKKKKKEGGINFEVVVDGPTQATMDSPVFTRETGELDQLKETIGYSTGDTRPQKEMVVDVQVKTIHIKLCSDVASEGTLIHGDIAGIGMSLVKNGDTMKMTADLGSLRLSGLSGLENEQFPDVISSANPFVKFSMDMCKGGVVEGGKDISIEMDVAPLYVVLSTTAILRYVQLLTPSHQIDLSGFLAGRKPAIPRNSVTLKIDAKSPTFIIPITPKPDSLYSKDNTILILDLGEVSMCSFPRGGGVSGYDMSLKKTRCFLTAPPMITAETLSEPPENKTEMFCKRSALSGHTLVDAPAINAKLIQRSSKSPPMTPRILLDVDLPMTQLYFSPYIFYQIRLFAQLLTSEIQRVEKAFLTSFQFKLTTPTSSPTPSSPAITSVSTQLDPKNIDFELKVLFKSPNIVLTNQINMASKSEVILTAQLGTIVSSLRKDKTNMIVDFDLDTIDFLAPTTETSIAITSHPPDLPTPPNHVLTATPGGVKHVDLNTTMELLSAYLKPQMLGNIIEIIQMIVRKKNLIRLDITAKGLRADMLTGDIKVCRFDMKEVQLKMEKCANLYMKMDMLVEGFDIEDYMSVSILPAYRHMLSSVDNSALFVAFNYSVKDRKERAIKANMSALQLVLLPSFLSALGDYALDLFQYLPSLFSGKKSTSGTTSPRAKRPRGHMELNVVMESHTLIIPTAADSSTHASLALGRVHLASDAPGPIERMTATITPICLSLINTEQQIVNFMEDLSIDLTMENVVDPNSIESANAKLTIRVSFSDIKLRLNPQDTLALIGLLYKILPVVNNFKSGLKVFRATASAKPPSPRASPLRLSTSSPMRFLPSLASSPATNAALKLSGTTAPIKPQKPRILLSVDVSSVKLLLNDVAAMFIVRDTHFNLRLLYNSEFNTVLQLGRIHLIQGSKSSLAFDTKPSDCDRPIISLTDNQQQSTVEISYTSVAKPPYDAELNVVVRRVLIALDLSFLNRLLAVACPLINAMPKRTKPESIAPARTRTLRKENSIVMPFIPKPVVKKPAATKRKHEHLHLRIHVESPHIAVTVDGAHSILVDLGSIDLDNAYYTKQIAATGTDIAHESMTIGLSSLSIQVLHGTVPDARNLMENVNIQVVFELIDDVTSLPQPSDIPHARISITCRSIHFQLSRSTYTLLLDTALQYLHLFKATLGPVLATRKATLTQATLSSPTKVATPRIPQKPGKPATNTRIDCELSELRVSLFSGNGEASLSLFIINGVQASVIMAGKTRTNLNATIRSLRLMDARVDSGIHFIDLLCSKNITTFGSTPLKLSQSIPRVDLPLISFTLAMDKLANTMTMKGSVDRLRVYIAPQVMLHIIDFFVTTHTSVMPLHRARMDELPRPVAMSKSRERRHTTMEFDLNKLKILLVENPSLLDSNLVIGKVNAHMTMTDSLGCNRVMDMSLTRFQIFSFRHGIANVSSSRVAALIDPATITTQVNILTARGPDNSRTKVIEVSAKVEEALNFFLSYHDTMLIKRIVGHILRTLPIKSKSKSVKPARKKSSNSTTLGMSLDVPQLTVALINDHKDQDTPLLDLSLYRLAVSVQGSPPDLVVNVSSKVIVDYFNIDRMAFEPLIENWQFKAKLALARSPRMAIEISSDQVLNINVTYGLAHTLLTTYNIVQADLTANLYAPVPTVPPMSISDSTTSLPPSIVIDPTDDDSDDEAPTIRKSFTPSPLLQTISIRKLTSSFHPYWIVNKTGVDIVYRVAATLQTRAEAFDDLEELDNEDKQPIVMDAKGLLSVRRSRDFRGYKEEAAEQGPYIVIQMRSGGFPAPPVPIGRVGCTVVRCNGRKIAFVVGWSEDGSKLITVRSSVTLRNETTLDLAVRISGSVGGANPQSNMRVIFPKDEYPVPLPMLEANMRLSVLPACYPDEYEHASEVDDVVRLNDNTLTKLHKIVTARALRTTPIRSIKLVLHADDRDDTKDEARDVLERQTVIRILPPLVIENLLPCPIAIGSLEERVTLQLAPQESGPLYCQDPRTHVQVIVAGIPGYPATTHTLVDIEKHGTVVHPSIRLEDPNRLTKSLNINVSCREEAPSSLRLALYAPYWIINKTGLPINFLRPKPLSVMNNDKGMATPQMLSTASKRSDCQVDTLVLYHSHSLMIRLPNSLWSRGFSLETVGRSPHIYCETDNSEAELNFCASIALGKGRLQRTKMVTIDFHYILVNETDHPILIKQAYVDAPTLEVPANSKTPFHWPLKREVRHVELTRADHAYEWSSALSIDDVALHTVKMRSRDYAQPLLIQVDVRDTTGPICIHFIEKALAPFRIENGTPIPLKYAQVGCAIQDSLAPYESVEYAWDALMGTRVLVVTPDEHGATPMECNILKIKTFHPLRLSSGATLHAYMRVDGDVRVLVLAFNPQTLLEDDVPEIGSIDLHIDLPRIGVSLVDAKPHELLYLSLTDITLFFSKSNLYSRLELAISALQIDNQMHHTDYPVMFYPTKDITQDVATTKNTKDDDQEEQTKPFLHFSFVRNEANSTKRLNYFELLSLLVQESNVMLDDALLAAILEMFTKLQEPYKRARRNRAALAVIEARRASKPQKENRMIYVKLLLLHPIKILLSFSFVREGLLVADIPSDAASILLEVLGVSFGLERTTLSLNSLILEHPFLSQRTLARRIKTHYIAQSLNQLYKVIGSSDGLGNPVGLFKHLGTGVFDFFYEPAQAILSAKSSPRAFGRGMAKGSLSLLRNSVYGLFNSLSKISSAMGKGVSLLSFDEEYMRTRHRSNQRKARHAPEGIAFGVKGLGRGIIDGVTGIVRKPIEGAMEGGVEGFAMGMLQGVVGAGVKPVVGVLDLVGRTTEGIKNNTGLFRERQRMRAPRPLDNTLAPYDAFLSEGLFIVATTFRGAYRDDKYVAHFKTGTLGRHITVITSSHLITVKSSGRYSFRWGVKLSNIASVDIASDGLLLHFASLQRIQMLVDYREQYTIHLADKDQLMQLYIIVFYKRHLRRIALWAIPIARTTVPLNFVDIFGKRPLHASLEVQKSKDLPLDLMRNKWGFLVVPVDSQILNPLNNHYYQLFTTPMTEAQAQIKCRETQNSGSAGYLATFSYSNEFNWAVSKGLFGASVGANTWISGSDPTNSGVWTFSSGPETGVNLYNSLHDRCYSHCLWGSDWNMNATSIIVNYGTSYTYQGVTADTLANVLCEWGGSTDPVVQEFNADNGYAIFTNIQGLTGALTVSFKNIHLPTGQDKGTFTCTPQTLTTTSIRCTGSLFPGVYTITFTTTQVTKSIVGSSECIIGGFCYSFTKGQATFKQSLSYSSRLRMEGYQGHLATIAVKNQLDCLTHVLKSFSVWESAVYDSTASLYRLADGPKVGSATTLYSSNILGAQTNNAVYYITNAGVVTPTTQESTSKMTILTVFTDTYPWFQSNYTHIIPTTGTKLTLTIYNIGTRTTVGTLAITSTSGALAFTVLDLFSGLVDVTIPAGVDGPFPIIVSLGGTKAPIPNQYYQYSPPTVDSFTPAPTTRGGDITITGSNFTTNIALMSLIVNGGSVLTTIKEATVTSVIANVAPGTGARSATLRVGHQDGLFAFNYQAPTVTSIFAPISGISYSLAGDNFGLWKDRITIYDGKNDLVEVTSVTDHSSLLFDIPAWTKIGDYRVNVDGQLSNTFSISPKPVITSVSQPPVDGGSVTISGQFLSNTTLSGATTNPTFTVGGQLVTCTYLDSLADFTDQIVCPVTSGTGNLTVTANVATVDSNTYAFSYQAPNVFETSETIYKIQSNVTITGVNFATKGLVVSIGGEPCTHTFLINSTVLICDFNGVVPPNNDTNTGLYVSVTVDSQQGGGNVFYYIQSLPCPGAPNACSNQGSCNHYTGFCTCNVGWDAFDCSLPSSTNGNNTTPKPDGSGGTIIEGPGFNFTIAISHLREIDPNGATIRILDMLNITFHQKENTSSTYRYIGTFANDNVTVDLLLTIYETESEIVFAGETIPMPAKSMKYLIRISTWDFSSPLNTLQVIYRSTTNKETTVDCQPEESTSTLSDGSSSSWYQINSGGSVLKARFANKMYVDSRIIKSSIVSLAKTDPLFVQEQSNNQEAFVLMTSINVPSFQTDTLIDPNFSTLILSMGGKDSAGCSKTFDTWKIIVIAVSGGLVLVGIAAFSIFLYKSNLHNKAVQNKLHKISSGST